MIPEYPFLEGNEITSEQFNHKISTKIFKAIEKNKRLFKILEIKTDGECDIFLFIIELDIPSKPVNDISDSECVAIVVKSDNSIPKVYALREDFPLKLPHTNLVNEIRPVDLCIYEENFSELQLKWSGIDFIYDIKKWFELTSIGELHQENQPLEPFYVSNGIVIYDSNLPDNEPFIIGNLATDVFKLYTPNSFNRDGSIDEGKQIIHCYISIESVAHGVVRRAPQNILEFAEELKEINIDLNSRLEDLVSKVFELKRENFLLRLDLVVFIEIKLENSEKTKEEKNQYFFKVDASLLEIGLNSEYLKFNDTTNTIELNNVANNKLLNNCESIKIKMLNPHHDFTYNFAKLLNKNIQPDDHLFCLIGVGALGSQFLNNIVRQGYGKWNIVDPDIILPHNLSKHVASRKAIGINKAEYMTKWVNDELFPIEKNVQAFTKSILDYSQGEESPLFGVDYVIDISTSIAVERYLANNYSDINIFSAFLNPSGNSLVLLSCFEKDKYSIDLLEYQYYNEIIKNPDLREHLIIEGEERIRYALGCRDITSKISQDNLSIFSGILSSKIKQNIISNKSKIEIWQLNDKSEVNKFGFELEDWNMICIDEWKIYVNQELLNQIYEFRSSRLPNETGGILLGGVDTKYKRIYVVNSIFAPGDSVEKRTLFIRGIAGVEKKLQEFAKITADNIGYLGEWHSHPEECSLNMSSDDKYLFSELINEAEFRGRPSLMIICGNENFNLYIGNHEF